MKVCDTITFINLNLKYRAISESVGVLCDCESVVRTNSYNSKSSTRHNSDHPQNMAKFEPATVWLLRPEQIRRATT